MAKRVQITPDELLRRTEIVDLSELRPHPRNARNGDTDRIGGSIRAHGLFRAVVVSQDGVILAGNHTYMSALEQGQKRMAIHRLPLAHDDPQALEIMLADNGSSDGAGYDRGLHQSLLESVLAAQGDLEGTTYGESFLQDLMRANAEAAAGQLAGDPDDIPAPPAEPVTKPGDLWRLGPHRLLCGDGAKAADLERLTAGAEVSLIVTSPPYNQRIENMRGSGRYAGDSWVEKLGRIAYRDSLDEDEYQQQQSAALLEWREVLKDGGSVFYNHKNRYRDKEMISPLRWLPGPFRLRQEIVWKRNGGMTHNARMFLECAERIYWLYKGEDFTFDDQTEIKTWSTVWEIMPGGGTEHPVAYPVELPLRCLRACSRPGEVVLDPFAGSGTTLIAAHMAERIAYLMEIEPRFCDVILRRWEEQTGIVPVLEPQGLPVTA